MIWLIASFYLTHCTTDMVKVIDLPYVREKVTHSKTHLQLKAAGLLKYV